MDMNALRRQLDSFNTNLEDVNKLLLETDDASEGLVRKMKELSGIGSKGGIIRSIVTRFSVAVPSLYKLTQQVSSLLLIFRYVDTARTESLKEEAKVVESLKRREDIQRRLFKLNKAMSKNNLSALEKEQYYNDASIKNMLKSMTFNDALLKTQEKMSLIKDKIVKADNKIFKAARKRYVRENYGSRGLIGGSLTNKAAILMADDEVESLKGRKSGLQEDFIAEKLLRGRAIGQLNTAKTESEKREAKANLSVIEARMEAFSDAIENVTDEIQIASEKSQGLIRGAKGFSVSGERGSRKFKDLTFFEKQQLKYEEIKKKVTDRYGKIKDGYESFFSKGNIKMMKNNAMKFGKILLYALGFIIVLGVIVYMLKQLRFFERAGEIFKKIKETLIPLVEFFTENIGTFITEIMNVFGAIKDIFVGLFTGDGEKIWSGGEKLLKSLWKAFKAYVKVLLSGALLVLTGLAGTYVTIFGGLLYSVGRTMLDALINIIKSPVKTIKRGFGGASKGAVLGGIAGGILGSVIPGAGTMAGVAIGSSIGGTIGGFSAMAGMASGGTNLLGGNYLVGENGPEIVSIPGGSSVINNTNTRSALGPTINVHVNGRLGASDQELNEIARKIGNKINIEMNRFNSRGYRA